MVQLKYFGDDRDVFKYDLIRTVLISSLVKRYAFVPMLTKHRDDAEGKMRPRERDEASHALLKFIATRNDKSLQHWETWLSSHVSTYKTVEPVDGTFFSETTRETYWKKFRSHISEKDALVFVDPDTGLQTGSATYLIKMGCEKYILNRELSYLIETMADSSVLMIYQHLTRDKTKQSSAVTKKIAQVHTVSSSAFACAYREGDLAFLFVSKKNSLHKKIAGVLRRYHAKSGHKFKSVHIGT